MNMEKLNSWMTLLSNIGVMAGLIFLAVQIQLSNDMIELETRTFTTNSIFTIADKLIEDPTLIEIMLKERNELTNLEKERLDVLGRRMIQAINQGFLGSRNLERQVGTYRNMYNRQINFGMPGVWPEYKAVFTEEFVQWFDTEVVR